MLKNTIIAILALTTVFFMWVATTQKLDPLVDTYEMYNHIRIYEDGSYSGQYRSGYSVTGCIKNAQCND